MQKYDFIFCKFYYLQKIFMSYYFMSMIIRQL